MLTYILFFEIEPVQKLYFLIIFLICVIMFIAIWWMHNRITFHLLTLDANIEYMVNLNHMKSLKL